MRKATQEILDEVIQRRPDLAPCRLAIEAVYAIILASQRSGGRLLVCGNGGSAADAQHIVGELMKPFFQPRPVGPEIADRLRALDPEGGDRLAAQLHTPIRAVSLVSEASLLTALINDVSSEVMFAQQVLGYGPPDVLLAISTSGRSANVLSAARVAKATGIQVVALTGPKPSALSTLADCTILAPGSNTPEVQEAHLPLYHALCLMLEAELFGS